MTSLQRFLTVASIAFVFHSGFARVYAQGKQTFPDVPPSHYAFEAVEYLNANGHIKGYPDGTFKPEKKVNRAEATKFIVAPRVTNEVLAQFTTTPFGDIATGEWYLPYVEVGRQVLGFIDGPPSKPRFEGARPVLKVEFFKMLLGSKGVDLNAYANISEPLSADTSPSEWYQPYLQHAIARSLTTVGEDELLRPGKELTRAEVAIFMFRSIMYDEQRRTQALLSAAENDILTILSHLEKNDIDRAERAAARALLAARGAHASKPDVPIVQGALKITEAFHALVRAYRAGLTRDFDSVITYAKDAWRLAEETRAITPDMSNVIDQLQKAASSMADSARGLQGQQ